MTTTTLKDFQDDVKDTGSQFSTFMNAVLLDFDADPQTYLDAGISRNDLVNMKGVASNTLQAFNVAVLFENALNGDGELAVDQATKLLISELIDQGLGSQVQSLFTEALVGKDAIIPAAQVPLINNISNIFAGEITGALSDFAASVNNELGQYFAEVYLDTFGQTRGGAFYDFEATYSVFSFRFVQSNTTDLETLNLGSDFWGGIEENLIGAVNEVYDDTFNGFFQNFIITVSDSRAARETLLNLIQTEGNYRAPVADYTVIDLSLGRQINSSWDLQDKLVVFGQKAIELANVDSDVTDEVKMQVADSLANVSKFAFTTNAFRNINLDVEGNDGVFILNDVFGNSVGSDGADLIIGGAKAIGGKGNDIIVLDQEESYDAFGNSGDDVLIAGEGDQVLIGGSGDDKLFGGKGDDRLIVGDGNDALYGGEGRLCRVSHDGHIMRYGYLPDGKLAFTKAKLADEDAVETIRYRYRADGSLQSMRYPSGLRVTYSYDDQGRVASLLGAYETGDDRARFTILRGIRYDALTGRVRSFTHGNGIKTRYRYDSLGQLTKLTRKFDGNVVGEDVYVYNADGLIEGIDRLNNSNSRRYGYDGQGRLIHEVHGDGTASNTALIGYSYDSVGNRLKRTVDNQTRAYNYVPESNQLQSVGQNSLTFDARGNLLEDRSGGRSFDYDVSNRMQAFYRNGQLRAEYDYDANGRRIRKRLHRPNSEGVKSIRFLYDTDGRLISETSRREDRRTLKARDLVWLGTVAVAQVERRVKADGTTKKANVLSLHTDHLGAPRLATDEAGIEVWSWYGDAFGAKTGSTPAVNRDPDGDGKKTEVSLRFPGQYHDRESGLWYNNQRDYDAKLGRYIQSDPIGLSGGVNRYAYVNADPVQWVDPNGLSRICYQTWGGVETVASGGGDLEGGGWGAWARRRRLSTQYCWDAPRPGTTPSTPITIPVNPTSPPPPPTPPSEDGAPNCNGTVEELAEALNQYLDEVLGRRGVSLGFESDPFEFVRIADSLADLPQRINDDFYDNETINGWSREGWHPWNLRIPSPSGTRGGYHIHTETNGGPVYAHFDAASPTNGVGSAYDHGAELGITPSFLPYSFSIAPGGFGLAPFYRTPSGPGSASEIIDQARTPEQSFAEFCGG